MSSGFSELGGNWKSKYTKGQRKMRPVVWGLWELALKGRKVRDQQLGWQTGKKTKQTKQKTHRGLKISHSGI